jgi:hypothetical protein
MPALAMISFTVALRLSNAGITSAGAMARSILRQPVWLDFVRGRKDSPPLAMQRWIRLQFCSPPATKGLAKLISSAPLRQTCAQPADHAQQGF